MDVRTHKIKFPLNSLLSALIDNQWYMVKNGTLILRETIHRGRMTQYNYRPDLEGVSTQPPGFYQFFLRKRMASVRGYLHLLKRNGGVMKRSQGILIAIG